MESIKEQQIINILPIRIRMLFRKLNLDYMKLEEIRFRANEPLIIIYDNKEKIVSVDGTFVWDRGSVKEADGQISSLAYVVTAEEVNETLEYISDYSLYAYEDEIRQGFITIQGGHRVGLAGKVVLEGNRIKSVKYISFLNIRMSHQLKGCCEDVIHYILQDNHVYHTLIISPPRCGKTTLLRDIIRYISDGDGKFDGVTVGVVDERSEIGACYQGIPQNDLGIRTDIMDCCPKAYGMLMLIRSMSPQVIAVDEIGGRDDIDAIYDVINCGCSIIATVHGESIDDVKTRPGIRKLIDERVFERYIILNNKEKIGNVEMIFDERGSCLCG